MKIGALIVTTGLPRVSGVTALLPEVGTITGGQRMISTFLCAGISMVGLVVGPEEKRLSGSLPKVAWYFSAAVKIPVSFRVSSRVFLS